MFPVRRLAMLAAIAVAATVSGAGQGADPGAKLLEARDSLLRRLDDRLAADAKGSPPLEVSLLLEEGMVLHGTTIKRDVSGIRREPVVFSAFRFGDKWLSPNLFSPNSELNARLYVEELDASGLQWTGETVKGALRLKVGRQTRTEDMGHGRNMHALLKSQVRPVVGWTIGGRKRVVPSEQVFDLDVYGEKDAVLLELTLSEAAGFCRAPKPPTNSYQASWGEIRDMLPNSRTDIRMEVMRGSAGWLPGHARSPNWNLGLHDVDASGLELDGKRLKGRLVVVMNPDPWVPGGARQIRRIFTLDVPVAYGRIDGSYSAAEEKGESFEGRVTGSAWTLLRGTFRTKCIDGEWSGPVKGKLRPAPSSARAFDFAARTDGSGVQGDYLSWYRDSAAILAALRDYPPSPDALSEQLSVYRPAGQGNAQADARCAGAMAEYVKGWMAAMDTGGRPSVGSVLAADERFGPVGDSTPMASAGGKPNVIPATVGSDAPQQWQYPQEWRAIGPFVSRGQGGLSPSYLPGIVPLTDVQFVNERLDMAKTVTVQMAWRTLPAGAFPFRPPAEDWRPIWIADGKLSSYSTHDAMQGYRAREAGSRSFEWYATTELTSDREVDAHLAIASLNFGRLWVNDTLVWESGAYYNPRRPAVLPVRLRAGANRLLVLCGQSGIGYFPPDAADQSHFRLWVCTAGRPQGGAKVVADAGDSNRYAIAGYLGDMQRKYPDANPPVAWSVDKGINVAWQVPAMPGGEPVVWGESLYMNTEPHTLVCVDKASGRVKWAATNSILELLESAEWREKPGAIDEMAKALRTINEIDSKMQDVNRRMASDEIEESEVEGLKKQKAEMEAKIEALRKPFGGLSEFLRRAGIATYPSADTIGTFAATGPVVTQDGIWAYYGMGTVACYGHDGKRRWMVRVPYSASGARDKSPILVSDRTTGKQVLLLQCSRPPTNSWEAAHIVMALDPSTGKQVWLLDPLEGRPSGMTAVRIPGKDGGAVVLVTASGTVIDAFSGTVLQTGIFPVGGDGIPYPEGGKLYFANDRGQSLTSLWLDAPGRTAFRTDWVFRRGGNAGSWPITDGDCLYVPRIADEFHPHHVVPWVQLSVYDAARGQHLSTPKPVLSDAVSPEPAVIAGNYLYYTDSARPGSWSTGRGQIAVMTRGESAFVLARNVMGVVLNTVPVFDGDRMYIRGGGKLVCIRVDGAAGERYAEETMAEAVMQEVKRRPENPPLRRPVAMAGFRETPSIPVVRLAGRVPVDRWLQLGPLPFVDQGDPLASMGGIAKARPAAGVEVKYRDTTYRFEPMADDARLIGRLARVQYEGSTLYVPAFSISVLGAAKKQKFTTSCFYSVLHVALPVFMRYETKGVLAGSWLAGEEIKDGECVRFDPGYYPFMLRIDVKAVPPIGTPVVSAQFDEIGDPAEANARWVADIGRLKPRLERIVAKLPGTSHASVAEVYLKQLESQIVKLTE